MTAPIETFAGIPGTITAEAGRIRWVRGEDVLAAFAIARSYSAEVSDGLLVALVSQDEIPVAPCSSRKLWHLSVSHRDRDGKPDRCPNWDELKSAMYRLVQADIPMILIFPRRSTPTERYVNAFETTLHLWQARNDIDQ